MWVISAASHLAAPWFPPSPGCSSSFLSPRSSEDAAAPSPAALSPPLLRGSSPAALCSGSPAGSSTWPSPCGSSSVLPPCPTPLAGGRWPLPACVQKQAKIQFCCIAPPAPPGCESERTAYLILQLDDFVIGGLRVLTDLPHLFKLLF